MTDELAQIREGVVVRPGDTLVVRLAYDEDLEPDQIVAAREHIAAALPPGSRVCVIMADGDLSVVRAEVNPDDPDAHATVDGRRS